MPVRLPSFDQMLKMARTDPGRLETLRRTLTQQVIDNAASPDSARKLRGLQFRVDTEINRARSPLDAALRVSNLMCRSLARLRHAIEAPDVLLAPVAAGTSNVVALPLVDVHQGLVRSTTQDAAKPHKLTPQQLTPQQVPQVTM